MKYIEPKFQGSGQFFKIKVSVLITCYSEIWVFLIIGNIRMLGSIDSPDSIVSSSQGKYCLFLFMK